VKGFVLKEVKVGSQTSQKTMSNPRGRRLGKGPPKRFKGRGKTELKTALDFKQRESYKARAGKIKGNRKKYRREKTKERNEKTPKGRSQKSTK